MSLFYSATIETSHVTSRLHITRTSHAEHTVDHSSYEIITF